MVIELRVVQFWSEIILVISNQTRAARSFDFEITRMISDQIALHSVQLPIFIIQTVVFYWKTQYTTCKIHTKLHPVNYIRDPSGVFSIDPCTSENIDDVISRVITHRLHGLFVGEKWYLGLVASRARHST